MENTSTIKRRVLIAEDDDSARSFLERLLTVSGYAVSAAANGAEAKELLGDDDYDVVVSDISMPGLSGIQLLRAVRERDLDVPVILVTGDPTVDTAMQAIEYGALRYLSKPVEPQTLLDVIAYASRIYDLARIKREALAILGNQSREASDLAGLDAGLTRAISSLWMAYQPIVSMKERRVYAYEALLRSREEMLPDPGAVLDAAERLDRLRELGQVIRSRVVDVIPALAADQLLFVNLHPHDLADDALFSPVAPLSRHAERIVLEITERKTLDGVPDLHDRTEALRRLGYRFAVDDLGSGYAGLGSFVQLNPQVVKIDMSLVRDVHIDATKAKLIRSIGELCRDMEILVVGEGVETIEERDALVELGLDLLQGFLFARPQEGFATVPDNLYS